ncbi:MAG: RDD family protein, partial [Firmicutes bacterium]|nr:RDD family protein [Bacillota bacterium]
LPIFIYIFFYWHKYPPISIYGLLLILLAVFLFVNAVCLLFFRKTLIDIFSKTEKSKIEVINSEPFRKLESGNSFLAFLIDFAVIFTITILLFRILIHWVYIETIPLLIIVAFLYNLVFYAVKKQTFGKLFVGIEVVSKNSLNLSFRTILMRELVCKFVFRYLILFSILFIFWNDWLYIATLGLIINWIIILPGGEFWWDTIAKTKKIRYIVPKQRIVKNFLLLISVLSVAFIFLLLDNNLNNNANQKIMGFKYPFKKFEHPNNKNVKPYSDYLEQNSVKNPKDYVLELFKEHDIVILCENLHGEGTQWEMIYDIVRDDYFINHVGHIFTEYGCAKDQGVVDKFLYTTYENDTLLERETATLKRYLCGNFYFFMKKLNKLNQNLDDSLKIRLHYSDVLSWKYFSNHYVDSIVQTINLDKKNINRDSYMADVVMDWYRETGNKCLVITNYRHAFAVNNRAKNENYKEYLRRFSRNQAQYIYNQFPDKTANVYIFGHKFNLIYIGLVQKGKWKTAFKNNNYQPVGFNLSGTPFGEDSFDIYPTLGKRTNFKWQDLFTGLVFYKPAEDWTFSDYPYKVHAAQREYDWAVENNLLVNKKGALKYLQLLKKPEDYKLFLAYLNLYDYIDILLFVLISVITFLVSGIYSIKKYILSNVYQQSCT